jgi:D-alanyl-D-alanine carboxypeptidase/D-alanyl-D-alanine-endopeptidase (penicillin-binding protein 4)
LASLLAFSILASGSVHAVERPPSAPPIDGETGYAVINVASGKVLAASKAREGFIPASVAKLPAALVILQRLGPAYQFTTSVQAQGDISKGVLKGDLILVGGADPSLLHDDLEKMARDLKAAGVSRVEGGFYYDASALPLVPSIEPHQPDSASYNPPLGGLAADSSRFLVEWKKRKDGSLGPAVGGEIPLASLPVRLPVTVPPSLQVWLPVLNPGQFAAQVFAHYAAEQGIALAPPQLLPMVAAGTATVVPAGDVRQVVVSHVSQPLASILRDAMFYSNNMALETLAMVATKTESPAAAGAVISQEVQKMVPNVGWGGFKMLNASGLTDQARMSPGQCAALTAYAATAEFQGMPFKELLRGRTLDPFMGDDRSPMARLRTKTGTIFYARALSGVLVSDRKDVVAFCMMTNNIERRAVYDAVPFDQRADPAIRNPAKAWTREARKLEEVLVLEWAAKF